METSQIIWLAIGLLPGIIVGYLVFNSVLTAKKKNILKEAEIEGESLKKEKVLQAKEKFLSLKEKHEQTIKDKNRKIQSTEDRVKGKEKSLSKKIEESSKVVKKADALKADHLPDPHQPHTTPPLPPHEKAVRDD